MKIYFLVLLGSLLMPYYLFSQETQPTSVHEFDLEISAEYRYFYDEASFPGQEDHFPSLAIRPEYSLEWNKGKESLNFRGFFRIDRDDERTHGDIRELYYQRVKRNWELNVGLKKIFWGVTESNHLVDIINQTDQVESFDGEQKLGQPMVQFTYLTNTLGSFDIFYLPYHRKRNFPGTKGRLRFPVVIATGDVGYENDNLQEWHPAFALRWKHYFGIVDIGLSEFYGPGREPLFGFEPSGEIRAFYPIINQVGLDLQVTHDAFLWKLESIYRTSDAQDFFALTAGLEYTFSNINGKGLDIGLLSEYLFDDREELALTGLQNDLFFGSRIAFNDVQDTAILFGGIVDLEQSSSLLSVEAARRLGNSFTAEVEARLFTNIDDRELILSNFQADSFLRLALAWRL